MNFQTTPPILKTTKGQEHDSKLSYLLAYLNKSFSRFNVMFDHVLTAESNGKYCIFTNDTSNNNLCIFDRYFILGKQITK